jgi:hypothetical protein
MSGLSVGRALGCLNGRGVTLHWSVGRALGAIRCDQQRMRTAQQELGYRTVL